MDTLNTTLVDTLFIIQKASNVNQAGFDLIKDIILLIVAVSSAIMAFVGLRTWRKQLKGKTEYELAKRLLKAVYELREAIRIVRNPFISTGETAKAIDEVGIKSNNSKSDLIVYQFRWNYISKALSNLSVETLEAEVIWGYEIRELVDGFRRIVNELHSDLSIYLDLGRSGTRNEFGKDKSKKILNVVYQVSDDPEKDEFLKRIVEAIVKIEDFLRKYLKL